MIDFSDTTLVEPLKNFDSPDTLGKAYLDLETKVKGGDLSILGDSAKDPHVAKYKNLGDMTRGLIEANKFISSIKKPPAKMEDYKFSSMSNLHKGITDVGGAQKAIAALAFKHGLTQEQADGLQQDYLSMISEQLTKTDEARSSKAKEVETKLRSEWKENYDKNYNNVKNVLERIGLTDLATDLAGNPTRIAGFHKLTSLLSEDSIGRLGESGSPVDTKSKEGATNRIKQIMEDPKLRMALANDKDENHQKIKKEWMDAHAAAYAS